MSRKGDQKYQITIRNWDQYQREMQGGEKRRRRRSWVAISVDLFSDPDFFKMDLCHRSAWVGLLCHAGKVGPVFDLCASDARVMFQLRSNPDFEVFKNQGFIDLEAATDKTDRQDRQDRQVKKVATLPKATPKKKAKAKKTKQAAVRLEAPDDPRLNLKAFTDFQDHRKDIKKPMTEKAMTLTANKLMKLSHEDQQICVDNSIEGGWQGLFPEKLHEVRGAGGRKLSYSEQLAADMREKGMIE